MNSLSSRREVQFPGTIAHLSAQDLAPAHRRRFEFWSSAQLDTFMGALMRSLSESGLPSEHRFEVSQKDYRKPRGRFGRLGLRARMYGLYPLHLYAHSRRASPGDIRVVCTNTFYAPFVTALAQRRSQARLVHLVYDLYPDVLFEVGLMKPGSLGARLCDRVVRSTFKSAAANVFLGKRLLAHAESRFGGIPNARIIAVGADGSPFADSPPEPSDSSQPVDILYCGNLGRLHDIETVVSLLRTLPSRQGRAARFVFHASGPKLQRLAPFVASANRDLSVHCGGFLSGPDWTTRMKSAEVALVTMVPGAERVLMPSKTYSALVAGQAILAICSPHSDLADLVREHQCGWVVSPGDVAGLAAAVQTIRDDPSTLLQMRRNAFRAGHSRYSADHLTADWANLLQSLPG